VIETNLSTRPFYNVRAVQAAIGALAAVVVIVTLFNVVQLVRLTASQRTLGARAVEAENESARLRQEAARIRSQINPTELTTVANAAREANGIIDRRAFSWTELFAKYEETLPPDVRITAVQPRLDQGRFIIGTAVQAKSAEDLDAFIENLEKTGYFTRVLATTTQAGENGLDALIDAQYVPADARAATTGATATTGVRP
jgi:Tfp pilus assembly protein PilN